MKYRLLLVVLFTGFSALAQTPYGNDWINFSQSYYKIKIAQDGVYRIQQNQLAQTGAPVQTINPKNLQLFHLGREIPLFVPGENDNNFDASDFIEFFAQKNDGRTDTELYNNATDQPHSYFSLYTDTAAYFLTWTNSSPGKRYTAYQSDGTGLTPEPYFMYQSSAFFTDGGYTPGAYILAETSLSEYTAGEGFLGAAFANGASQVRTINTPSFYPAGPVPIADTYVAGRSDAASARPDGLNHHLRIEAGNNGLNFNSKKDTLYSGYETVKNRFTLAASDIGMVTNIRFTAVNDLGAASDFQAPAYVNITYPRQFDLQDINSLKFTLTGLQTEPESYLRFSNSSLIKPVILDLSNTRRISASQSGGILTAVVPDAGTQKELYLYDSLSFKPVELSAVNFINFNPASSDKNFLIITHQSLLSKAKEYAAYRDQTGYKTLLVTSDQLYNQFYYGLHHPLAIRYFARFMLDKASVKPEYLLLLGKGQSNFYVRSAAGLAADLVPSIGNPPSDNLFTSGLNGTNWEPAIATGRIAAKNLADVDIYLQKLIAYERQPDSLWRKNLIHVSGGTTLNENLSWSGYQKTFEANSKAEFFGSETMNFQKFVNEPITDNLRQKIVAGINSGASFLSFFGHGSAQSTEINLGEPNELQNQNKLLVYLINGCNAGNPFTGLSIGEKFIFEPQKAAIGWLATSDEGVASYLATFSTLFYKNSFNTNYGNSVAQNLQASIKAYQKPGDLLNQTHSRQYIWQGDPALRFYSPQKPDYYIRDTDLFILPENVNAATDSFAVAIIAKNSGKALSDSLSVSVTHVLPDNSVITYPIKKFKPVYNTDTLYFSIPGNGLMAGGENKFTITLDAGNSKEELNETNNTAQLSFVMQANGINLLYPKRYGIANNQKIVLKAQSSNLIGQNAEYVFEIDTADTFNSPFKKSPGITVQGFMPVWEPVFTPQNNTVYYWRARINNLAGQENGWQQSSFTYIDQSADGWNQSHKQQFKNTGLQNIYRDTLANLFRFTNTTFFTSIQTRGDDASTADERTFRSNPGNRLAFHSHEFVGFSFIAMDPATLKFYSYPSPHNFINSSDDVIGYTGQFFFNTNSATELDSLIRYINNIPAGYYVLGFNGRGISLKDLPQHAKDAFTKLGCSMVGQVNAGEPYLFWGQKGAAPGTAIEKTSDPSSPLPARSQNIKFYNDYAYPFNSGVYISEIAGPAQKWKKAYYRFDTDASDKVRLSLIGINKAGQENVLMADIPADSVDVSSVNAVEYPFLKIKAVVSDDANRSPAQLKAWKFLYDEYPEGTINPEIRNQFYSKTIQQGDSVKWQLAYQNISTYKTDSIEVFYSLTKDDRSISRNFLKTLPPLQPGTNAGVDLRLPTIGLTGKNQLKLEFVPKNQQDSYTFNNQLTQNFTVERDTKEPLIDVVFDGRHIINNEIVSPQPAIHITVSDENKFSLLTDTAIIDVLLKKPGDTDFKRVAFSGGQLIFMAATSANKNKATVNFNPEKLADGIYTLKIRSRDQAGNYNTDNDYQIDFEVINESAITHFYPYPNPFTTSMKFVFTLTGDKIPDKFKIQILTVTGKIVREVLKDELGNIRIGNNISDFTWDGTDQFGDRLANGVYFYRVMAANNDRAEIKHRQTAGDKFFKNEIGKIYIMR